MVKNKGLHYVDHNALPFLAKNAGNIANELKIYIPPSVLSGVASGLVNSLATMSGNPELSLLLNPLVDNLPLMLMILTKKILKKI